MITAIMRMHSKALARQVSYTAIVPEASEAGPGPYHVLYQLHGASDDYATWLTGSNIVRYTTKMPFVVVFPDGAREYWLNTGLHERYEDFLINDLTAHIHNTFNVRTGKAAIGGLSMGGYGALRLSLKYPQLFASVWAHSAALWTPTEVRERRVIENESAWVNINDIAQAAVGCDDLPVISFDCGTEDFLITHNRQFHNYLQELGLPHTYKEHPGHHGWDYWDIHVREALDQHMRVLTSTDN